MSENAYAAMSGVYDLLNDRIDYAEWARYIDSTVKRFRKTDGSLMLDLGCGTGKMTFELRSLGYDMTALDISPEMLSEAVKKADERGVDDILWLCQDMTAFELYGTVDACVCCLDAINHLTEATEVKKCFSLVHNYLAPGGVFMFDLNTPYKFENVYGANDYILEDEGVLLAWQNDYDSKSGLCGFYLSVFTEDENGKYAREDAVQTERCYGRGEICALLEESGFEIVAFTSGFNYDEAEENAERWYITARRPGDK